jgi:GNAT superfamily N-acetyltransferase
MRQDLGRALVSVARLPPDSPQLDGWAVRSGTTAEVAYFGAWRAGRLVGASGVRATSASHAYTRLHVEPPARRQGVGRALVQAVLGWADQRGLQWVTATVVAGSDGEAFAAALGASILLHLVTVVRDLGKPVPCVAAPPGVRLLRWPDHAPDEWLEAYAALRRAVGDAPDAHLQMDVDARTATWVRDWERAHTATGDELWVCAAVAEATGELVGFTEAHVPTAGAADQHDTAVLPAWRGQGIGTWLKAEMLAWLQVERPAVETLTSTINQRNTPMLRVSAAVGFRQAARRLLVGFDVTDSSS